MATKLELGRGSDVTAVEPLTGGVGSDIVRVRIKGRDICMKFALPKLKVKEDWRAPVRRNAAEYAWLQVVAEIFPASSVELFGCSEEQHGFAMEYLAGNDVYLWKDALLNEADDRGEAQAVGDTLGRIHSASTSHGFVTGPFQNRDDFRALRIEPYITFTAVRHPDLPALTEISDMLYLSTQVLVHGDVSPKNIFFREGRPIILDAECVTMGDASFDLAFCLNHLVLKAVHLPKSRTRLLKNVIDFWQAYTPHVTWENQTELEARVCRLLPVLMLARVDGKSPVEYLNGVERDFVQRESKNLILKPETRLAKFLVRLSMKLEESKL